MAKSKKEVVEEATIKEEKTKQENFKNEEPKKEKVKQEDVKNDDEKSFKDKVKDVIDDVKDNTSKFSKSDIENGKVYGILSYISLLCLIPFFAEKQNKYVQFHAKQGLNLVIDTAIAEVAVAVCASVLFWIPILGWIIIVLLYAGVSAISVILAVMGIISVAKGEAKELPLVNKLRLVK